MENEPFEGAAYNPEFCKYRKKGFVEIADFKLGNAKVQLGLKELDRWPLQNGPKCPADESTFGWQ